MLGRVISAGIIAFWVIMMTLLVRSELLHSRPLSYSVPIESVMQKMFEGEETSDLVISYQGNPVGECTIRIVKDRKSPTGSYSVKSALKLDFEVFGKPVRLQSDTDSEFDHKYQMTGFRSLTTTGDSKIELQGTAETKEIQLVVNFGELQEKHTLPFSTLEKMGPSGAMGLFGMGGMQTPRAGKSAVSHLTQGSQGPVTTVLDTQLELDTDRVKMPALLVDTKYDDTLWSKIYVSPSSGEILKVETSFGVVMLNTQFALVSGH